MNIPKLQFGKTEIAAEKLFVGVFTASMALCSGFYIWGMLFLSSSQNQMELYLTKGVYLCGVVSLVSAALAVLLCLFVAAIVVPAVAAGTYKAVKENWPERLSRGDGVMALPAYASHSVRAPNVIVYQYGGEPLQSACVRLERVCQEVLASEIPAVIWAPRGENLVKIYSRSKEGQIESISPTREEMELGISWNENFVFANETEGEYHQFLAALCTAWDNNQTKYRAMREKQTGVDRFLSFAKAPSAVLNCVLFLICLIPSVLSANIVSDVKAALPADVLFSKPADGVSVVFTFEKCPAKRTGDGKQTVSQLLASDPAFDADANLGRFISVSVGNRTYGAMPTSAAPKPLFDEMESSLPDSGRHAQSLKEMDKRFNDGLRELDKSGSEILASDIFDWLIFGLLVLAIIAWMWAVVARNESALSYTGHSLFGPRFAKLHQGATFFFVAIMLSVGTIWMLATAYYAKRYGDFWTPIGFVFCWKNLPLLGLWIMSALYAGVISWAAPNPNQRGGGGASIQIGGGGSGFNRNRELPG